MDFCENHRGGFLLTLPIMSVSFIQSSSSRIFKQTHNMPYPGSPGSCIGSEHLLIYLHVTRSTHVRTHLKQLCICRGTTRALFKVHIGNAGTQARLKHNATWKPMVSCTKIPKNFSFQSAVDARYHYTCAPFAGFLLPSTQTHSIVQCSQQVIHTSIASPDRYHVNTSCRKVSHIHSPFLFSP